MKALLLHLNFKFLRSNLFNKSFLLCFLFLFALSSFVNASGDSDSPEGKNEQDQKVICESIHQGESVDGEDGDNDRLPVSFARDLYFIIEDGKIKFTRDKYASIRKARKDHIHLGLPTVFAEN